jgi:hypothetical protein
MGEFVKNPIACLTLASYLITNTGEQGLGGVASRVLKTAACSNCEYLASQSVDNTVDKA